MTEATIDRLNTALEGRYRLERTLGQGGMATVYLAEDLKHHRNVAVKVLREDLSASVGAARFLREIEIAAQLQHPNILPLLDSGDAGGLLFYVMPYVEGQSLRERLRRGGELPVGEAIRLLVEIVDALAYAHEHGVVHRDIKPDNVMLTGRHALVTDFGVAKAVSEATGSDGITSMGVALGTPAYMAPEQAVADPHIDQRADIYALGVLGYELLTGTTPFAGVTPQQVLAAHITEDPAPVTKHRPGVPEPLATAVMRCLQKRPADRWQTAGELLVALEPLATPSGGTTPAIATPGTMRRRGTARRALGSAALAVALVAAGWQLWHLTRVPPPTLVIGRSAQLTSAPGLEIQPAISPDGKLVAYAAGNSARMRIFLRPIEGGRTLALSDDTTAVEYEPRWAPDGTKLLFLSHGGVSVSPALGGASTPVIPPSAAGAVTAATWSPDGNEIAFVRGDSLLRVPATGGTPKLIGTGRDWYSCAWAPEGARIACATLNSSSVQPGAEFGNLAPSAIVLVSVDDGTVDTLAAPTELNESPVWARSGRRLYFLSNRDGPRDIYAVDISGSGKARGKPVRLTTGLNAASFSLSTGSADRAHLAYDVYTSRSNIWSVPIPSGGATTIADAKQVTFGSQVIEAMSVSHDAKWLLYDSNLHGNSDIYRMPIGGGTPERLTSEPWDEFAPNLSPDGTEVAYHSFRTGTRDIEVKPLNGGPVQRVTATPAQESFPYWSPDGRRLVFTDQEGDFPTFVATRGPDGKWSVGPPIDSVSYAVWSPNGPWIAGVARLSESTAATGQINLYDVDTGALRHVYQSGKGDPAFGFRVCWSPDGRTLYLKSHDKAGLTSFWALPVAGGRPRLLVRFTGPSRQSARVDFTTDGTRFYFTLEDRESDVYVAEVSRK
jgi:serine/threonine-protein kinase